MQTFFTRTQLLKETTEEVKYSKYVQHKGDYL